MQLDTNSARPLKIIYFFIFAGLLSRILGVFFFPPGMEGDEVAVVYWGRQWIQTGRFVLISADELAAWETPAAYFFGALDLMGFSPRIGAVALSFIEIGMCYLWARRRAGHQVGLLAAAFLAMMPWHFFFSYVLGPCVAGLWTSLYLMDVRNPLGRMAANIGGIFYYASFRVLLIWGALKNLLKRNFRNLLIDVMSGVLALAVLFAMGPGHLQGFFKKGSYLMRDRGPIEWMHHYLNAIVLWWVPPLQVYWQGLRQYSMDDVGFGFANVLGFQTPLSFGISVFFALGLYVCSRNQNKDLVFLFILSIALVGFTPAFVHFPFILPVVAFVAASGALRFAQSSGNWRWIYVALLIGAASQAVMLYNLDRNDRWQTFTGAAEKVPSIIKKETNADKFIWLSGYDFYKDRLVADRHGLTIYPFEKPLFPWLSKIKHSLREQKTSWIFIQTRTANDHPRPEVLQLIREMRQDLVDRSTYLEMNLEIKSKKELFSNGQAIGTLYEVDR